MTLLSENWAVFVEGNTIKWSYGVPDTQEFQDLVLNFLNGLGTLGKDLFGEGIASLTFDLKKHSGFKASEILIVSLYEEFNLLISDPPATLRLIASEGGIPCDIKEVINAVLVGQASILFSNSIDDVSPEEKKKAVQLFTEIIIDLNEDYLQNDLIKIIVNESGCNFSNLTFEECLLLHVYLRKQAEKRTYTPASSWCLISHIDGGDIPFSFNLEDEVLFGGYFSAIITFISVLFESLPKTITFGSTKIQKLRFVYGTNYFMAIDTFFMVDLLLRRQFQSQFFETRYEIMKDLSTGIKNLIIEEILHFSEEKLNELSAENLLDAYFKQGSENLELFIDQKKENVELLREEHKNQVLRVWGLWLSKL